MSAEHVDAVLRRSKATGTARLVLIVLAHRAEPSGLARVSQRGLARMVGVTNIETIRKAVRRLERLGEIETVVVGAGPRRGRYRVLP